MKQDCKKALNSNTKLPSDSLEDTIQDDDFIDTPAAAEMTGLIYRAAQDNAECEAYEETYPYLPNVAGPETSDKKR